MQVRLSEIRKPTVCEESVSRLVIDLGYKYAATLEPTTLVLDVTPVGTAHRVKGSFDYRILIPCSRCLHDAPYEGTASFFFEYRPCAERPEREEIEVTDDNAHIVYYDDDTLLPEELVRSQMYLEVPAKPLCSESCRGLCPRCGVNLNESKCRCAAEADPRWAQLASMNLSTKE